MKHFKDYKTQWSESFKLSFILGIIFLVFFSISFAQTANEIRNKIDVKNLDIEKLEQEIKAYQNELDSLVNKNLHFLFL